MSTARMYYRLHTSVLITTKTISAIYTMALPLGSLEKSERCVCKNKNSMKGIDYAACGSDSR